MSKELKKIPEVKVFGLWPTAGIEANDPGLKRYISTRPILLPHTSGRHEHGRFRKSTINIVERLIDDMMRPGVAGGAKARRLTSSKTPWTSSLSGPRRTRSRYWL